MYSKTLDEPPAGLAHTNLWCMPDRFVKIIYPNILDIRMPLVYARQALSVF